MKWLLGLVAVFLVGIGVWFLGNDDPGKDEISPGVESSERVPISRRERQLTEVREKSARVLGDEEAQSKIEAFLENNGDRLRSWDQATAGEFNSLVYSWGVADPRGAMAYVSGLNGPADLTLRDRMRVQIMRAWGLVDHEAAFVWLREPGQEREKDKTALLNLLHGMHQADPGAVDRFLVTLPESEQLVNQTHIKRIARLKLNSRGLEEATRWAKEFPMAYVRKIAMNQIAEDIGTRDPEAAVEWAAKHAGDPSANSAVARVVSKWKRLDSVEPEEIANWTKGLSPGEGRIDAMALAVANWARVDPVKAAGFVQKLTPGEERQKVISNFAPAIAKVDPEAAIEWAGKITDQEIQDTTMIRALVQWAVSDQEAAKGWMETAEVTPKVREAVATSPFFGNRGEE